MNILRPPALTPQVLAADDVNEDLSDDEKQEEARKKKKVAPSANMRKLQKLR